MVETLVSMGVITIVDRAVLAAYCQAYGRCVEAEEKLKETPLLIKTLSGYVQQSPWLGIANRQIELMGRYMAEIGPTPSSRSRIAAIKQAAVEEPLIIQRIIFEAPDRSGSDTSRLQQDGTLVISREDANL
jgi:P27 family predicted phage terminase small subunit